MCETAGQEPSYSSMSSTEYDFRIHNARLDSSSDSSSIFGLHSPIKTMTLQSSDVSPSEQYADPTTIGVSGTEVIEEETITQFDTAAEDEMKISNARFDHNNPSLVEEASHIAKYMSRPTKIYSTNWTTTAFASLTFPPWQLYMSKANIKKKLDNFMFFRGTMKLKVILNASPFHYGDLRMSYRPFEYTPDNIYAFGSSIDRIPLSQRPGIDLRPQDGDTYDLTLPFFYHKDMIQVSRLTEWEKMGTIHLDEFVQLAVANASAANNVTITVYGWFEDVQLSGATNALSLQSSDRKKGKSSDEYGNGVISGPASAIADAAGKLTSAPFIGPYARATELGASAVSKIAKLFGYTDVPIIDHTTPFKNMPFSHMASAHSSEPTEKLFLDPKGELTIDPRTVGLGEEDEMAFDYICTKESLLTSFSWAASDAAETNKLMLPVSPSQFAVTPVTGSAKIAFTPMGHLSQLFYNWRGDIDIRLKVICSKFHRGRLLVTWDPLANLASIDSTNMMNVAYQRVIDIGTETDVNITIPYMQATKYMRVFQAENYTTLPNNSMWLTAAPWTSYQTETQTLNFYNGILTVKVLNQLSSPSSTANVTVLVYSKGKENIEFANPSSISDRYSSFAVQSSDKIANTATMDDNANQVVFGESIRSVRPLLRRHNFVEKPSYATTNTDQFRVYSYRFKRVPPTPGYIGTDRIYSGQAKGLVATTTNFSYSFANWIPLTWMRECYLGERGSVKHAFYLESLYDGIDPSHVAISRENAVLSPGGGLSISTVNPPSSTNAAGLNQIGLAFAKPGTEGILPYQLDTMGAITLEAPNNTQYNMCISSNLFPLGTSDDGTDLETFRLTFSDLKNAVRTGYSGWTIGHYAAAGTDYNLFFYLNAPVLFLNNSGATSVIVA